jgi:nucleoside-triphosphatase THEP1
MIGLLTGRVGAGKTTVAGHAAALAHGRGYTCGGILAPALLDASGAKIGIRAVDLLTGEGCILARIGQDLGGPAVGPYSFDASALTWAIDVVGEAVGRCDLLIVDEIGRLELEAGAGLAPVLLRLAAASSQPRLVLVRDWLLPALQRRLAPQAALVFEVTPAARDGLPAEILARLMGPGPNTV